MCDFFLVNAINLSHSSFPVGWPGGAGGVCAALGTLEGVVLDVVLVCARAFDSPLHPVGKVDLKVGKEKSGKA